MQWTEARSEAHPRPPPGEFDDTPSATKRRRRGEDRVIAACDLCKERKVKCDGQQPCSYCRKRSRSQLCTFSGPKLQSRHGYARTQSELGNLNASPRQIETRRSGSGTPQQRASQRPIGNDDDHRDTEVPLEARLLRDAQGKMIFIGDCAPMSFLQTVRQLIASKVSSVPTHLTKDSVIEAAAPTLLNTHGHDLLHAISKSQLSAYIEAYCEATCGIVELFDRSALERDIVAWAGYTCTTSDSCDRESPRAALFYIVLAIGAQEQDENNAEAFYESAKHILMSRLANDMSVASVSAFALLSIYMLRASQPNAAYLNFGLAARSGYAIGLHRGEVNASFGSELHTARDRIWKSLRVVDMLISNILGRPTSTADIDCTVDYEKAEISNDHLSASVQIFLIIERIVLEVYSRKRISLRIASFISQQLKSWATRWLQQLTVALTHTDPMAMATVIGACQTMCSYYYGIMLLTRPFLIYQLYEYLGTSHPSHGTHAEHREKVRYADAALDAAAALIDTLKPIVDAKVIPRKMPMVVSWLFTTSLVLAVGLLGQNGLTFEGHCRAAIACLAYFAELDPHARRFQEVAQTLFNTARSHVEKHQELLRTERKRASAQLFGLPMETAEGINSTSAPLTGARGSQSQADRQENSLIANETNYDARRANSLDLTIVDQDLFALPWLNEADPDLQDFLQPNRQGVEGQTDIPLFPMYERIVAPATE